MSIYRALNLAALLAVGLTVALPEPAHALLIWRAGPDMIVNEKPDLPDGSSTELSNPNAQVPEWSYGHRTTVASASLTLFSGASEHVNTFGGNDDVEGWTSPLLSFGAPTIFANVSGVPTGPLNPDELLVHPGDPVGSRPYVVVRWTVPTSGTYEISADWRDLVVFGSDTGFDAHIVVNGVSEFDAATSEGGSIPYVATAFSLTDGDVVDFVVGANGGMGSDSTGFTATITQLSVAQGIVPEPSTLSLLALAFLFSLRPLSRPMRSR